jgi:hypothetical protein
MRGFRLCDLAEPKTATTGNRRHVALGPKAAFGVA